MSRMPSDTRSATPVPIVARGTNRVSSTGGAIKTAQIGPAAIPVFQNGADCVERQTRSRHQPSKSGPAPADHSMASRWQGVRGSGPSRQPHRFGQLPTVPGSSPSNQEQGQPNAKSISQMPPYRDSYHPRPCDSKACKNDKQISNDKRINPRDLLYTTYEPCDCLRCTYKSRSIHVKPLFARTGMNRQVMSDILTRYFQTWGYVEACELSRTVNGGGGLRAFIR
jgi:hypothetical protein